MLGRPINPGGTDFHKSALGFGLALLFWQSTMLLTAPESAAQESSKSSPPAIEVALPKDLPQHWRLSFLREPVFNSRILVAEVGDVNRPSVLLVHGLGQRGLKDWIEVIPALESDYHVIALDLPGFGYSDAPKGRYSPSAYARILYWLKQSLAKDKLKLVGHSMGGAVSLRFSAEYPDDVERLVLVDAAGILHSTAFLKHSLSFQENKGAEPSIFQSIRRGFSDFKMSMLESFSEDFDPYKLFDKYPALWDRALGGSPNGNAAFALMNEDFSQALDQLTVPTWIIWGAQDPIAPRRTATLLLGKLKQAELTVMPDVAHVPMTSHSAEFNRILHAALIAERPVQRVLTPKQNQVSQGHASCYKENGLVFEGRYESLKIKNCKRVLVRNVFAKQMDVRNSQLAVENLVLDATGTAMNVKEADVEVTNAEISGRTAIQAHGSNIDLAGVTLRGKEQAVSISQGSHFTFSVSELISPYFSGSIHGDYTGHNTVLDSQL